MPTEQDIVAALRDGGALLSPLELRFEGLLPQGQPDSGDALINLSWGGSSALFAATIISRVSPKRLRDAVNAALAASAASGLKPLIVTSYLAPARLEDLEQAGVSGIDLCGNGIVVVPGELFVFRTGQKNLFPADRSIQNIYKGASSQVARVFLVRPTFESVQEVNDEIKRRGGEIALSTVSKALKALAEDLAIERKGPRSSLLQPELILERLAKEYRPAKERSRTRYQWTGTQEELDDGLSATNARLTYTGAASVSAYGFLAREKTTQAYCADIPNVEAKLGDRLQQVDRFPDLELIETQDPLAYFDARPNAEVPIASPIQTWLELQAGDKRQQDAANSVKTRILDDLTRLTSKNP